MRVLFYLCIAINNLHCLKDSLAWALTLHTSLSCSSRRSVLFLLMWRLRSTTNTPSARMTNASRPPTTPAATIDRLEWLDKSPN